MKRLGYTRFVAQGGDRGCGHGADGAAAASGTARHPHQHASDGTTRDCKGAASAARRRPASRPRRHAWDQLDFFYKHGLGYATRWRTAHKRRTRSRIRRSAWRPGCSTTTRQLQAHRTGVRRTAEGLTRDDILDNTTLYWLTNTAVSSARLYWENKLNFFAPKMSPSRCRQRLSLMRSISSEELGGERVSQAHHYNRLEKGGHFAAWEQPQTFSEEFRAAFRALR